jgi:hypothetical protein
MYKLLQIFRTKSKLIELSFGSLTNTMSSEQMPHRSSNSIRCILSTIPLPDEVIPYLKKKKKQCYTNYEWHIKFTNESPGFHRRLVEDWPWIRYFFEDVTELRIQLANEVSIWISPSTMHTVLLVDRSIVSTVGMYAQIWPQYDLWIVEVPFPIHKYFNFWKSFLIICECGTYSMLQLQNSCFEFELTFTCLFSHLDVQSS